jgi:hypothetical protein
MKLIFSEFLGALPKQNENNNKNNYGAYAAAA